MYREILTKQQKKLLPILSGFREDFYLVGGTAIALQLGHRRSIDFDLFKAGGFGSKKILNIFDASGLEYKVLLRMSDQLHLVVKGVKITFFEFPYQIVAERDFEGIFRLPDLLELGAMKAFAFGKRSKWKDYVDVYFLLKNQFTFDQISERAEKIFGGEFSAKLFAAQLSYFDDIDYREKVEYLPGKEISEEEVKKFLVEQALEIGQIKDLEMTK
jgi:hypothetical protein